MGEVQQPEKMIPRAARGVIIRIVLFSSRSHDVGTLKLASSVFLYVGVIVAVFAKGQTFNYLMVIPGYSVLIVWLMLSAAYISKSEEKRCHEC